MNEEEIFHQALARTPEERPGYLEQACAGQPALRAGVEALLRANLGASNFLVSPGPPPPLTVDKSIAERPGTVLGPYKLLEQIGEGGFGVVFMAEQTQPVRRRVALKVLKPGMDTRQVVARFEAERQALAIMDHPNIAQIHDGGATASGRPYFVMELVKGAPMTDFCDQHQFTPRQRLELFVPVCQAVQHAHHKGVIHRDLKPSNVMVTMHDTTPVVKVIDFGVAKALGQALTDKTLFTGFAQMVGTPLYMSPEQAGQSGLDIDTRSDIYCLGVLLYELLTGTTPFSKERFKASTYEEIRRIIREEDPPLPSTRLSNSTDTLASISAQRQMEPAKLTRLVRGELDWIVMRALEKDRNRRYQTANGFAQDLQRYLADEPVLACPPSVRYRFGKFTRRHKAGLGIAAAAALVSLLAAAGLSWGLWEQATRRTELSERMAETERTVSAALIETQQWGKLAGEAPSATSAEADAVVALWRQAEASLDQAEAALRTGTADGRLRQQVVDVRRQTVEQRAQAQRTANLLRDLDDAHMRQAIWIETHWDFAGAATKYAAAFSAYGLEVTPGRTEELARRIRAEPPAIRESLLVALDHWWYTTTRAKTAEPADLVQALAAAADDDSWRRRHRAAVMAGDATALRALSGQARQLSLPPSSLELLAVSLGSQGEGDEALALLRWACTRHLTDFWIHARLGFLLEDGKDPSPVILEEAIGCFRTALALRPDASAIHNDLGICLGRRNQLDDAILCYRKAIQIDPKHALAHNNLGGALRDKNQLDEAIAEYGLAIKIDPNYANAHNNLGLALRDKNQLDEAVAEYHRAIVLDPKLAGAHNNLGLALQKKNQLDESIAEYKKAIELDPRLANAHNNLGNAFRDKNQVDEAVAEYHRAIELGPKLAEAHYNLGVVLQRKNQLDEAVAQYHRAIELDPNLAEAHNNLGNALRGKNQLDAAVAEYRRAIELDPKLAGAHNNLGLALQDKKQLDESIAEYKKAIELDPKLAGAHSNLGVVLRDKNQLDEAVAEYKKAIELDPKSAEAHTNLGLALQDKNQLDEAVAEYKKAIELDPKLAMAHHNLGLALQEKNQLGEAIAEYKKAIELGPRYALAHCNLGAALTATNQFDEAMAEYRRAIELDPKLANAHNNLGKALRDKNRLDEAIAEYRKAIDLDPKSAMAHNGLGVALYNKQLLDEAIAEYRRAIEVDDRYALAHYNLGVVLQDKNRFDEAMAEYRRAIELDPKHALTHYNLGNALKDKNQFGEAMAEYRRTIEVDPKHAEAHNNLGVLLWATNQLDEAIAECRKAIQINPQLPEPPYALGRALLAKGRFAEAKVCTQQALELLAENHPLRPNASAQLANLERLLALEAKLPGALADKHRPTDALELLGLLEVCRLQQRNAAAARLYPDAFTADSKLADDVNGFHRYNAACFAALAAASQGTDAGNVDEEEQTRLRQQALAWLRADLDVWSQRLDDGQPAERLATRQILQHWQRDTDLAGVRDADAIQKLPAHEQSAWRKLWVDVAELLNSAGSAGD